MRSLSSLAIAALVVVLMLSRAYGGVIDHPLPAHIGANVRHAFTVPGFLNTEEMTTAVQCTSLEVKENLEWAVEVFRADGSFDWILRPGAPLRPGHSDVVSPQATVWSGITTSIPLDARPRSARIVSTSPQIICSGQVLSTDTDRPTVAELPLGSWKSSVRV